MPLLVKEIMSTPAHTIAVKQNAQDAGKLMRRLRRGFLIVVKNKRPVGVVSDSDLINGIISGNKKASEVKISAIMKKPLITVGPDDDILVAVRKMKKNNVHRLPVVNEGKIVGVISLTDIAKTSPEMLDLLEYRLKMKEQPFAIQENLTAGLCDSCFNYSEKLAEKDGQWLCENCQEETEK